MILACGLLTVLYALPASWSVAVFGLAFALAAWEWSGFGLLGKFGIRLVYVMGIALLMALAWAWSGTSGRWQILLWLAVGWWGISLVWICLAPERQHSALTLLCGVPVLVPAFVAVAKLRMVDHALVHAPEALLWMLTLVFGADVGAYFVGRAFGAHKMAPRVSPGKTWEGAAGGLSVVAILAWAGAHRFDVPVPSAVAFGCGVGMISMVGDLTESMFKRAAGLKDSGVLLPGHGGVLDRIDSITAAAPLFALGLFATGLAS